MARDLASTKPVELSHSTHIGLHAFYVFVKNSISFSKTPISSKAKPDAVAGKCRMLSFFDSELTTVADMPK